MGLTCVQGLSLAPSLICGANLQLPSAVPLATHVVSSAGPSRSRSRSLAQYRQHPPRNKHRKCRHGCQPQQHWCQSHCAAVVGQADTFICLRIAGSGRRKGLLVRCPFRTALWLSSETRACWGVDAYPVNCGHGSLANLIWGALSCQGGQSSVHQDGRPFY
jgi:hypothetical protein